MKDKNAESTFLSINSAIALVGVSERQFKRLILRDGIKPFIIRGKQFWTRKQLTDNLSALKLATGRSGKHQKHTARMPNPAR